MEMMGVNQMKRLAISIGLALPLAGCGGSGDTVKGSVTPRGPVVEYPAWVMKGSGAFSGDKDVLYGVGSADMIGNTSLARTTAGNRARAELSKVFDVYSASLMKDYASSTTAGQEGVADEQQMVEQAIKTFSANHLTGVQIVNHWIHPTEGTIYALARMDMGAFENMIDRQKQLSQAVKERVKRASAKAFADLEAEEAKQAAQ
jgi:hypothetical protein